MVAAIVVVPTFMEVLDTTIAVVALRYIAGGLSATVDDGEWVLTSYLAANAIILPITGWLSAHLGRRNYFLASIAIFTLSSLLCGLAGSLGQLILFRVIQGLAGVSRRLYDGGFTYSHAQPVLHWNSFMSHSAWALDVALDYEAYGIEVEGELVDSARLLADDFDLEAEFVHGSFVPRGAEDRVHKAGTYSWFTTEGDYAYDEMGLDPDDFDVVYAYSWPDEEAIVADLFDRYAGAGAILVSHHGGTDFRLRRKALKRKRR